MKFKLKKILKIILNNTIFSLFAYVDLKNKCKKNKKNIWLLGTANYNNIGDLAISTATKEFLTDNFYDHQIYEIRLSDYDKYKRVLPLFIKKNEIIVLQGGGNLGVNYFSAESNRREIMLKYKNNPIVLFPSTIDYGESKLGMKELKESIKIYNSCKKLTLIAREEKTYNLFNKIYKANIQLTPDIVFYMSFNNKCTKNDSIGICFRNDLENNKESIDLDDIKLDMKFEKFDNICHEKNIRINMRDKIIKEQLEKIASYPLVITDRLHTMIFCYITKTPCIAINNSNGKIEGVYKLWLNNCNYIYLYKSGDDLNKITKKLLNIKYFKTKKYDKEFSSIQKILKKGELK